MNIPNKVIKNGLEMPLFGKGNWFTNLKKNNRSHIDEEASIDEIKAAIVSGVTYFDTAERYANGLGEQILGKAIKGFEREKLFLTSKLSSKHLNYQSIILEAKQALNRMQIKYLDIYFIHHLDKRISLKDTMKAMDYLMDEKMIRNIGVCNFTKEEIEEAESYSKYKISANQLRYNFMSQEVNAQGIIEYCQQRNIMIIAWRPFPQDLLTDKITTELEILSKKYNKTHLQIASAWLMLQKNMVVLAKLSTEKSINELFEALSISFNTEEHDRLAQFTLDTQKKKKGIHKN